MLEVHDLNAGYGKLPVLRNISLNVQPCDVLLVVGENGAGKSTLMRTIAGFIRPTSGTIRFDGEDVSGKAPEENARAGLRLVLDGHRVFPELSIYDNLRLGATLQPKGSAFEEAVEDRKSVV